MIQAELKSKGKGLASLSIHDSIGKDRYTGGGVGSSDVAKLLQEAGDLKRIELSVNSGGGRFDDGLAIYTVLKNHPAFVHVTVAGIAASAASLLAMAGDEIEMAAGALLMIHNPSLSTRGGRKELESALAAYDRMRDSAAGIYAARSGQSIEAVHSMMDVETWLSADEAVEKGFASSVSKHKTAMAVGIDLSMFGTSVPEAALALVKAAENPVDPEGQTTMAQTVDEYKAEMKRFKDEFGADDALAYLDSGLSYEQALGRHVVKVKAELKAANDEKAAALTAKATAEAALAAVKLPGETTPVPPGGGSDDGSAKNKTLASLIRFK